MSGKESFDKILQDAGVALSPEHNTLITEAFHKIGIADRVPKRGKLMAEQINLTVDNILAHNPGLQPFAAEIVKSFVDTATQASTKALFNNEFDKIRVNYPQQKRQEDARNLGELSSIVQDLTILSKDANLAEKIGPKNAKEFVDKVKMLGEEYAKAPANKKGDTLLEHLESLKGWSQDKEKESKSSTLSKIGGIISSYAKAVGSWLSGNDKAVAEHKLNASQAIKELTQSKQVSRELGSVGTKTQSWTEKITQERAAKGQAEQRGR